MKSTAIGILIHLCRTSVPTYLDRLKLLALIAAIAGSTQPALADDLE